MENKFNHRERRAHKETRNHGFPFSGSKSETGATLGRIHLICRTVNRITWTMLAKILSPSAVAFGFGAIASKRSEDGGEKTQVRAGVKHKISGSSTFVMGN
jgi:hypothetical protein